MAQAATLKAVAWTLASRGNLPEARELLEKVGALAAKIESPSERARIVAAAARVWAAMGVPDQAQDLLTVAEGLARRIDQPAEAVQAWDEVAHGWRETGNLSHALELLSIAETLAHRIENLTTRTSALRIIAESLASAGQWAAAHAVAQDIEQPGLRDTALATLVKALAQAGQWTEAETITRSIEVPLARIGALDALMHARIQTGSPDQARKLLIEAEMVARKATEPGERAATLTAVVELFLSSRQWAQAESMVQEIDGPKLRAEALMLLVAALVKAGQLPDALRIVQRSLLEVSTRDQAVRSLEIASPLIASDAALSSAFVEAFYWVDTFFIKATDTC